MITTKMILQNKKSLGLWRLSSLTLSYLISHPFHSHLPSLCSYHLALVHPFLHVVLSGSILLLSSWHPLQPLIPLPLALSPLLAPRHDPDPLSLRLHFARREIVTSFFLCYIDAVTRTWTHLLGLSSARLCPFAVLSSLTDCFERFFLASFFSWRRKSTVFPLVFFSHWAT